MTIFKTSGVRPKTLHLLDDAIAKTLLDRASDIRRRDFQNALWVGGGGASALKDIKTIDSLTRRDLCVEGAYDQFPFPPESLDLIVINGTLHTVNDLPGALVQMRRALKPDGVFLCALIGGETLYELRDSLTRVEMVIAGGAAPRIHPMVDLQTMAGLMQRAGFTLPVTDAEVKTIFYRQLKTLIKDIKASGEGMALASPSRAYLGKTFWPLVEADYKAHHASADGLLEASIEIIYAIGWGPADTQQKPLKPGSAKHKLADALGGVEGVLPDKAKP